MSVYNITHFVLYDSGTGNLNSSGPFSDVADDMEPDATFEAGDTFVISSQHYSYAGQMDIDGTLYPALNFHGNNPTDPVTFVMIIMDTAPVSPPASLNVVAGPSPVCFAKGSLIATPAGESRIEDLQIGDTILTSDGSVVAIKWIGRQTVRKLFCDAKMQPVRIRAGALGNDLPHSDLTVTADHGMVIDGMVINASALVNGDTIDFVPFAELDDSFTVYHIETEAHDVILANGAPSETFIDAAGRAAFDNHAEYLALYGAERIIPQMTMPRISSVRLVPQSIRTRLRCGTKGLSAAAPLLKRVS